MGAEILPALLLFIAFGMMIGPAIRHDNELPVSVTGKERK